MDPLLDGLVAATAQNVSPNAQDPLLQGLVQPGALPSPIQVPTAPAAVPGQDHSQDTNWLQWAGQKLRGVSHGVQNVMDATAQMLPPIPYEQQINQFIKDKTGLEAGGSTQDLKAKQQAYQDWRASTGQKGFDWPAMIGTTAAAAPMAAAAPAGMGVAGAAALGGLSNMFSTPVTSSGDFSTEKLKQAGIGAGAGAAGYGLGQLLGLVLAPKVNPDVQTLMDAGVTPTPGQILGGGANRIEQGATSIPVVGDVIKNAQRRTVAQFDAAAINRSLEPIGEQLPAGVQGRDAISYAVDKLGNAYDSVLGRIGSVKIDLQLTSDLGNLKQMVSTLPKDAGDQFDRIIQNEVLSRADANGNLTGEAIKAAESNLGTLARGYGRALDVDKNQMAGAISEVQNTLRSFIGRAAPNEAAELQAINSGYANLMRPQRASAGLGAEGGMFTPAQLQSAVKALDRSKNNRAFATGNALMQDLSEAGKNVMGSIVPDSGTPFRHAVQLGAGAIVGHSMLPGAATAAAPFVAGGAGMAMLPYTPMGQRMAAALLTQRPELAMSAGRSLQQASPYLGGALAPLLANAGSNGR